MVKYLVLAVALMLPVAAFAKGDCKADKEKFCAEVAKAEGDVGSCLDQHKTELSDACKKKREAVQAQKTQQKGDESGKAE